MKTGKVLVVGILTGFLFLSGGISHVSAAVIQTPSSNEGMTAGAGSGKLVFGVDYSDVLDRKFETSGSGTNSAKGARVTGSKQVHAKVLYAVNQYLNIYGKVGGSDWKDKLNLNNGSQIEVEYKMALSWGIGANGGVSFSKNWQIFYDLQFLSTPSADVQEIRVTQKANSTASGNIEVSQFHLALGIGKEFHTYYDWASVIFPYIGISMSTLRMDHNAVTWSTGTFGDELEEDQLFGVFAGIRFANESNWTLELQGRVGDESSISASVDYRF
ncbi:MAG: hypothetical protein HYS56_01860 [Candidatus Omnitrophica bacterium]|nr:hypothetical protein [Candidatus Omnitrophota bacterium]